MCNVFVVVVFQVLHPKNPFAPTLHFNYRYFETDAPKGAHSMLAFFFFFLFLRMERVVYGILVTLEPMFMCLL